MDDWLKSFSVALGFEVNTAQFNAAKKTVADYEAAVRSAEKRIEDARWAGAKSEQEIAKLTMETNLKEARAALAAAEQKEKAEQEATRKREARHKEFMAGMSKLALAATAMATAVSYATNRVTQAFDHLGFVSARTGASVQGLNSLAYAFKQVGGTSQQAIGAVESFAKAIRENSGVKGYVQSLGVDMTNPAEQQLLDTVEALNKHPYDVGFREAGLAGISEEDYKLLTQYAAKIKEYRAEYNATTKALGIDSAKAAEASMAFQRTLTRLQATISALSDKLMISLAPALERILKGFNDWIAANPGKVDEILTGISNAAIWLATKLGDLLKLFTGSNGDEFMKKWEAFGDRMRQFADNVDRIASGIEKIARFLSWSSGTSTSLGTPRRTADILNQMTAERDAAPKDDRRWYEKVLPKALGGKDAPTASGGDGDGMRPRARRGLNRLARSGNVQAIVGELRQAGYGDNAIAAVVGSMETESSFNPRAHNDIKGTHDGLWQWDRTRWAKVKNWIQSQGGDPYDAGWQTKAWVAEHNAKPGDAMYDHPRTARGGAILRNDPTIDQAIHGVRESERFGAGEEGGRARHAREWLPQIAPGGTLGDKAAPQSVEIKAPKIEVKGADGSTAAPQIHIPGLPRMMQMPDFDPMKAMTPIPPGANSVVNNGGSTSKAIHQTFHQTTTVNGAENPRQAARIMESAFGNMHSLALANAQSATV